MVTYKLFFRRSVDVTLFFVTLSVCFLTVPLNG